MRECYHSDATVTTNWLQRGAATFVAKAETRSASHELILSRVGAPVVYQNGHRAVVELPSTMTCWIPVHGVEAELVSFTRLRYRVENRDDVWKICDLSAINEGDSLHPSVPGTNLQIDLDALTQFRHSYRYLVYTRSLTGDAVSANLYGTDRPEAVSALNDDAFTWMVF